MYVNKVPLITIETNKNNTLLTIFFCNAIANKIQKCFNLEKTTLQMEYSVNEKSPNP